MRPFFPEYEEAPADTFQQQRQQQAIEIGADPIEYLKSKQEEEKLKYTAKQKQLKAKQTKLEADQATQALIDKFVQENPAIAAQYQDLQAPEGANEEVTPIMMEMLRRKMAGQ
jgi:hypothetical protein